MPRGKRFEQYLAEQVQREPGLADELEEEFQRARLGVAIARFREQRGMSQQALADVSGIKQPMIARIERGTQAPTLPTVVKLLRGLNASLRLEPDGRITVLSSPTALTGYAVGAQDV
jgi:transcriptional regulator with XRE-family HTH domain